MVKSCKLFEHTPCEIFDSVRNTPLGETYHLPHSLPLSERLPRKCNSVIVVPNFKGVKYCILEIFHHTFCSNEPFLSDSKVQ